ncbi:AtpZ/AtpI family protein [Jeotgalibaca caeni]|uniref:AtpZ/AtpI family protein n=1 Tax=Jeotgalibaca caeni TaxID=3028623 RepID=UPI00237D6287|nr:AtpZ/AtpI family protein [Jeotgalibaca caeni]MDE1548359.1 AtpZ/AtpI family protein [Jeotgalibaca caeni]
MDQEKDERSLSEETKKDEMITDKSIEDPTSSSYGEGPEDKNRIGAAFLPIGIGVGVAIGVAIDQLALGLLIGIAIGLVISSIHRK